MVLRVLFGGFDDYNRWFRQVFRTVASTGFLERWFRLGFSVVELVETSEMGGLRWFRLVFRTVVSTGSTTEDRLSHRGSAAEMFDFI